MTKRAHYFYISILSAIVFFVFVYLLYLGLSYYNSPIAERPFHENYENLRPSGLIGHGLGFIGSFSMILGITLYMLRKRWRKLSRLGLLKHWLEFHIFLCTLGPIMILFHTSFKFGGIVSVSFWSMVAVFLSGIIGRFIYIQIPRSIEGRELSLSEVSEMKNKVSDMLSNSKNLDEESYNIIIKSTKRKIEIYKKNIFARYFSQKRTDKRTLRKVKSVLKKSKIDKAEKKQITGLVKSEISLHRRIERLDTMKNLFKYWHVAHLPFAIVMLTIMIIHIVVTLNFGYTWIF